MQKRYDGLDGLRGVAAFAVLAYHCGAPLGLNLAGHGYLAVDFFFVLSGFVIAHAYEAKLTAGMGFRKFALARVVRLWPVLAAGAVIGLLPVVVRMVMQKEVDLITLGLALALGLTMIPSQLGLGARHQFFPLNPPAWSLFWELAINAAYAATARFLSTRTLVVVVGLGAVGTVLASLPRDGLDAGVDLDQAWAGLARVMFSFPCGVLLYRLRDRFTLRAPLPVLAGLVAAIAVAPFAPVNWPFDVVCVLLVFPAVVAAAANDTGAGPLSRLAGELSYPLYATHYALIRIFSFYGRSHGLTGLAAWPLIVAEIVAAMLLAWAVLKLYDEPVRKWLRPGPASLRPSNRKAA